MHTAVCLNQAVTIVFAFSLVYASVIYSTVLQVPSHGDVDHQVALEQFLTDVPSLGLVGNKEFIDPRRPYKIDSDVQLVCKYLKAFDVGGKHGIDKQYKESELLFVIANNCHDLDYFLP